jgi:hypothetical protein
MTKLLGTGLLALTLGALVAPSSLALVEGQGIEAELKVGFKTEHRGGDDPGFVVGTIENTSRREYTCVRLELALSTRFDRRQQDQAASDLGTLTVVVEDVEALSTKSFRKALPVPAAVRLASQEKCPAQGVATSNQASVAIRAEVQRQATRRDHRGADEAGAMTTPVRKIEEESQVIREMEKERRKLEAELKALEEGGGGSSSRSRTSVVSRRGKAPRPGPVAATEPTPTGGAEEPPVDEEPPADTAAEHRFIGEIRLFGGTYAPRGWALCDGRLLPVSQHTALFSVLGTLYGGDGRTTFGLPDLSGPSGVNYIIALEGRYPPRN